MIYRKLTIEQSSPTLGHPVILDIGKMDTASKPLRGARFSWAEFFGNQRVSVGNGDPDAETQHPANATKTQAANVIG